MIHGSSSSSSPRRHVYTLSTYFVTTPGLPASYGSLARFKDIQRLYPLYSSSAPHPGQTSQSTAGTGVLSESADVKDGNPDAATAPAAKKGHSSHTCLAVAGDMSDFQYLKKILEGVV